MCAAIELGCGYAVYTPGGLGAYFALNNTADVNFVGLVTDVTGLDSPEVRENAQNNVAGDGGYHGRFWRGRRPWTISGIIRPQFPLLARDAAQEKIEAIMGAALAADGILAWTPADGIARQLPFRNQQPTRITSGQSNVDRRFLISGVAADWRIIAGFASTASGTGTGSTSMFATGNGNADAAPLFQIAGPLFGVTVTIANITTGKQIQLLNVPIVAGQSLQIDLRGPYPTVVSTDGTNLYGNVDPVNTDWSVAVAPGVNTFNFSYPGGPGPASVTWSDSWL